MNSTVILQPGIDLKEISRITEFVFSTFGLFLNFLLLYLILYKTNVHIKAYKKILLQNCVIDIIYNLTNFVTQTGVDFKDGNIFLIITDAWGIIPYPFNCILLGQWVFALFFCVTTLPVQFIFRYFLIVKNQKITSKQYILMLLSSFILSLSYTIFAMFCLWPHEPEYSKRAELFKADPFYYKGIPNFITADIREWPLFGIYTYCPILIGISYSAVVWTSYKVWKFLRTIRSQISSIALDVNSQITKTLIMQAITPLLISLFPIIVAVTMTFLRASINGLGIILSIFYSWIPIGNSLVTILAVKCYRNAVFSFFAKFPDKKPFIFSNTVSTAF